MNKHTLITILIAALVLLSAIGFTILWRKRPSSDARATTQHSASSDPKPKPAPTSLPEAARVVEIESKLAITLVAEPAAVPQSPMVAKVQGFGESAVLSDADGNPLLRATPKSPIYSVKPSPSGQQLVVSRGSGVHQVYRLNPFALVRELPVTPDVPRASTFEAWQWMDENTLIGVSATERPHEEMEKLTAAEQESYWRERTLLYSFDLAEGALSMIEIANLELPASFTVVEMHAGGLVKIEWDKQGAARTAWIGVRSK